MRARAQGAYERRRREGFRGSIAKNATQRDCRPAIPLRGMSLRNERERGRQRPLDFSRCVATSRMTWRLNFPPSRPRIQTHRDGPGRLPLLLALLGGSVAVETAADVTHKEEILVRLLQGVFCMQERTIRRRRAICCHGMRNGSSGGIFMTRMISRLHFVIERRGSSVRLSCDDHAGFVSLCDNVMPGWEPRVLLAALLCPRNRRFQKERASCLSLCSHEEVRRKVTEFFPTEIFHAESR